MPREKKVQEPNTYVLSPSDLTYLWDDCPRCFWLRYVKGQRRPGAFPRVFGQIDRAMRKEYDGQPFTIPEVGTGKFDCAEKMVKSPQYVFGPMKLSISGRIDARVILEQGVGLVDFKCSGDVKGATEKYFRQLAAYALAIEHTLSQTVRAMGLLMFIPETFDANTPEAMVARECADNANLEGSMHYLPIQRDDKSFMEFLSEVAELLNRPMAPMDIANCSFCKYTEATR